MVFSCRVETLTTKNVSPVLTFKCVSRFPLHLNVSKAQLKVRLLWQSVLTRVNPGIYTQETFHPRDLHKNSSRCQAVDDKLMLQLILYAGDLTHLLSCILLFKEVSDLFSVFCDYLVALLLMLTFRMFCINTFSVGKTVVCSFAITMDGARCSCYQTRSKITFQSRHIKNIEILPPSASCENVEIIVNLKNGRHLCLDPNEDKIKNIFRQLINKKKKMKN
uniref:Uncharacterized protein LOC117351660 n=1 Tax=Geotrypetes seraphini TaxID=260995 RepID=A0A6P8PN74_GEOSA|nr:uncharacterized protein LOC117351660 [Geotrypetes seraphini]